MLPCVGTDPGPEGAPGPEPQPPLPWPLSQFDDSPAAVRRRGVRFFHVVLAVMGGGGLWLASSVVIGAIAFALILAYAARDRYTDIVGAVDRLGGQMTELYAQIQATNRQIEDAKAERSDEQEPPRGGAG